MLRVIRLTGFIVTGLLLCLPLYAQETANPLLDMLKLVPDTEQTRSGAPLVSYADYRAIEAARGIDPPITLTDFDNRSDRARLWIAATNGVISGMRLDYFRLYLEGMEQAVGFAWSDIDRALTFGQPPSMGTILMGDFDAEAIADVFDARDYTSETQNDVTVWCGPSGCDEGLRQNLRNRDPANPFGGEFGREEPVALLGDTLTNSADYAVLSASLDAYRSEVPSLADDPAVQAAVNIISSKGTLRQAQLFNGADVGNYGDMVATDSEEQPEYLPVYALAFFADTYADDEQSALVGLVYDDEDSANSAATLMVDHLQMAESMRIQRPFLEIIEERGGQITGATVETEAATGKSVALLEIHYPMPANEEQDGSFVASSLVFRLLIESVYTRDATWLAADFTAPQ